MQAHRKVKYRFPRAPKGFCVWCGKPIYKDTERVLNKRKRWHQACANEYNLMANPAVYTPRVRKRADGKCEMCGIHESKAGCDDRMVINMHVDHIVPLVDGGGHGLDNMQYLCKWCHNEKTRKEASERAKRRILPSSNEPIGE